MSTDYVGPIRRVNRGRGHSYQDANGAKVPGVTTILGNGVPKPALINWAANATIAYAVDHWAELSEMSVSARIKVLEKARFADRDTAANRGTQVHKLGDQLINGVEVDVPDELAGHVESYVKFLDDFEVRPVLTETVVMSHSYGWAGTFDVLGDFPTLDKRLLYDVKTSRSGVWGETAWQLAGYRYADTYLDADGVERAMVPVDGCAVVHVRADGYSLVPMTVGSQQLRELRYINEVAKACESSRDYVGEEILPPRLAVAQ